MKAISIITILFLSTSSWAGVFFNYSLNFSSETDGGDAQEFTFSKLNNTIVIGGTLDNAKKLILAQSITSSAKSQKKGPNDTDTKLNLLELGPRIHYYFTQERRAFIALTYNFSAKGTAEVNSTEFDVEGTSIVGTLGYHIKVSKRSALGASLNYHSVTITSQSSNTTKSDVTNTYVAIAPMIEAALRF